MAITDSRLELATSVTCTSAAASTNMVDFGQVDPTAGANQHLVVDFGFPTALVGTSVKCAIQECATAAGNFVECASATATVAEANASGVQVPMPVHHKRFIRAYVTPTSITAGAFSAKIGYGYGHTHAYPAKVDHQ